MDFLGTAHARFVSNWNSFKKDFLFFSWMRLVFIVIFVLIFTFESNEIARCYYASFKAPPAFGNVDKTSLQAILVDYLDAQIEGNTVLVIGDCVTYGHGVVHPFTDYLHIKDTKIVNISMHTFPFPLMAIVIDEALKRGVRKFLIQLHPFILYTGEGWGWFHRARKYVDTHPKSSLKSLLLSRGVTHGFYSWLPYGCRSMKSAQLLEFAYYDWRKDSLIDEAYARSTPHSQHWKNFSSWLRNDLLAHWSLSRNRYAVEHWLGLERSFYSKINRRSDDFIKPLPEIQQEEILKANTHFWNEFVIKNRKIARDILVKYSLPNRFSIQLKEFHAQALFVMPPTTLDALEKYTVLSRDNLLFLSQELRKIVESHGYGYVDYLADSDLARHLLHYDSLTVKGQQLLGERLNHDAMPLFPLTLQEIQHG